MKTKSRTDILAQILVRRVAVRLLSQGWEPGDSTLQDGKVIRKA